MFLSFFLCKVRSTLNPCASPSNRYYDLNWSFVNAVQHRLDIIHIHHSRAFSFCPDTPKQLLRRCSINDIVAVYPGECVCACVSLCVCVFVWIVVVYFHLSVVYFILTILFLLDRAFAVIFPYFFFSCLLSLFF